MRERRYAFFFDATTFTFCLKMEGETNFMLENGFKTKLINELKLIFPGCIVVHLDPNEIQGIPDLLVLWGDKWAALEGKKNATASARPNQHYYVELMDKMSFARFIYPENKDEVIADLDIYFNN